MITRPPLPPRHSVLIVDRSDDTREVLRTVLESRDVNVLEASGARQGVELARQFRPEVIVLDAEADEIDDIGLCDQIERQSHQHHSRLVLLGQSRRLAGSLPKEQIMPKPYHFAPLIRKIEELLE